jgi:hypothetical protein
MIAKWLFLLYVILIPVLSSGCSNNRNTSVQAKITDSLLIERGRLLILKREYPNTSEKRLTSEINNFVFDHYIKSPFLNTKFFLFIHKSISPTIYYLMVSNNDSIFFPPRIHVDSKNKFDFSELDRFLNSRLLYETAFDKNKFVEFVHFYNNLIDPVFNIRKIIGSWHDIKFDRYDKMPYSIKKTIKPLLVRIDGNKIFVKLYVWDAVWHQLYEMNYCYKDNQYTLSTKVLGPFGLPSLLM